MPENIAQTVQKAIQDLIAPDVHELKGSVLAIEKRLDSLERHIDQRFHAQDQKTDAQFKALMSAIAESKAQTELTNFKLLAQLSERVPVIEAQRQ